MMGRSPCVLSGDGWYTCLLSLIQMTAAEPQDDDSADDCFGDVGFMFDGALPKTRRSFRFGDVSATVRLVDDDPGAVQSGHYVWPAAPALAAYLFDQRLALPRGAVLELGAGCGLAGLVAAQLPGTTAIVFTDHDPGVLEMIRDSIAEQEREREQGQGREERRARTAASISRCVPLRWGPVGDTASASLVDALADIASSSSREPRHTDEDATADDKLTAACGESSRAPSTTLGEARAEAGEGAGAGLKAEAEDHRASFELLIASDVIYSVSVVAPLFHTVNGLLSRGGGPTGCPRNVFSGEEPGRQVPSAKWPAAGGGDNDNDGAIAAATAAAEPSPSRGSDIPSVESLVADVADGGVSANAAVTSAVVFANSHNASACVDGVRSRSHRTDNSASCCSSNSSSSSMRSSEHSSGGGGGMPGPVFVMSQSFGYDPETERAIDKACAKFGLVRQVVWDELAPAAAHVGRQGVAAAAEAEAVNIPGSSSDFVGDEGDGTSVLNCRGQGGNSAKAERGGLDGVGAEGSAATADSSSLVSQRWRKGTKMQRFWRCA